MGFFLKLVANGEMDFKVKVTKKCLKTALPQDAKLSYSELITLLAQVSYTINCRPIGISSGNDLNEEIQPITPNMLLIGQSNLDVKAPEYRSLYSPPTKDDICFSFLH